MHWNLPAFVLAEPVRWNALLTFGSMLLFGLVGSYLVSRNRWVPRITGYLVVGLALGSDGLNWLSGDVMKLANSCADIGVALLVYQLGRYVDIGWLRRERFLLQTVAVGGLLCFALVWAALELLGITRPLAMLAGVLAIGTSPSIVMVLVRDLQAEGVVTRRLAATTALSNLVALLAIYVMFPVLATEGAEATPALIAHAGYSVCGSLLLAYVTYRIMLPMARWLGRQRSRQFLLVIAVIILTIGASNALQLPLVLTMLAFAIFSKNLDVQFDVMELEFGVANELFVVMLFVTIGASLRLPSLFVIGVPIATILCARAVAVGTATFAFGRKAKLRSSQAALLVVGTLPIAEAGLGVMKISQLYPHTIAASAPLMAGVLIVSELLGPIATQFALIKSGETGRDL